MANADDLRTLWPLDPSITFLNHGSFGACPRAVLDEQRRLRDQMEAEPVRFFVRELEPMLDATRQELGAFLGADPEGLVFVPNATAAINAVLRSMELRTDDEILTTSHEYNATRNVIDFVAKRAGASVTVVDAPLDVQHPNDLLELIVRSVTSRTRLAVIDHVTSQTAMIFPIAAIVAALASRGVEVLVDGAHAPGMLPLHIDEIGAAYYTGNLHKWVCAPKGAAFLHVREDLRHTVRPASISHGANSTRTDRSRFRVEFDWTGTDDPTPCLTAPFAIRYLGSLVAEGWPEVMRRNRHLALEARETLCRSLGEEPAVPREMIGSIAVIPLPDGRDTAPPSLYGDPLQDALLEQYGIEVPVIAWPAAPKRLLRISAQLYNRLEDYERLEGALSALLAKGL